MLATQDAIESKLYKPIQRKPIRKPPENICKVFFHNKAVEMINLPYILHNSQLKDTLNGLNIEFKTPTVMILVTQ